MSQELGILMLDTHFPRINGDIGNPATFSFPIRKKIVCGATPANICLSTDLSLLTPFIQAAQELEREGVRAITTSCGFLAIFQKELAASVSIPLFTSSLMNASFIYPMLNYNQKVGIITINEKNLTEKHLNGVGIDHIPKVIWGVSETVFGKVFTDSPDAVPFDYDALEQIMVNAAVGFQTAHPEIGAIVLECTNMPPFAKAIEMATHLPVYSIVSLANYVMSGVS